MDINTVSIPSPAPSPVRESVGGRADLSQLQRDFALHFVMTGGKARRAAVLAGYSGSSAGVSAHRNLVNPKVLAEIKRLAVSNVQAALPLAIQTLINLMTDPKVDAKTRAYCANSLLDRGGLAAPKGGVQVNVGVQVNGTQVQALIGEIWDAKTKRMSGIPTPMTDAIEGEASASLPAPDIELEAGTGGDQPQGPVHLPSPIPPSPTENSPE